MYVTAFRVIIFGSYRPKYMFQIFGPPCIGMHCVASQLIARPFSVQANPCLYETRLHVSVSTQAPEIMGADHGEDGDTSPRIWNMGTIIQ